jgi:hypothetical protein
MGREVKRRIARVNYRVWEEGINGMVEVTEPTPSPLKEGFRRIAVVKYPCGHYSYSNPRSQGALICQTKGFPDQYDPDLDEVHSAYSDRLASWDRAHFNKICEKIGTGDQGWSDKLQGQSDEFLKELGKLAFKLGKLPDHVRVVHHYNVSNGYSCPTIEVVCEKTDED